MGVDTKGFVATRCKDVFFAVGLVENALNALIQPHAKEARLAVRGTEKEPQYRTVDANLISRSQTVQLHFTYEGEHRTLWMNFTCDCDHKDVTPASISLSLGCWGQSELFMKTALRALSPLGDVYYDYSDCDSIDPAKLDIAPLTFVTACAAGAESPYPSELEVWKNLFNEGKLRAGTFDDVVGMSAETADELLSAPWETANEKLKAMRDACVSSAALVA